MSVPTDPVQALFALVVIGAAIFVAIKLALFVFTVYLGAVGGLYMYGHRVWGSVVMALGGILLGGLGWLAFQGLVTLLGWLL